uniref:Macro domain-containing protein n=2 Tax=Dendroctonus ponderosae TaxID=77166 RepID=J3JWP8_DENPD|nr:unknown [Dendroctonus ponderosae]
MVRNLAGNILTRCFRQKYSILFSSKVSKMSTELNWKSEKYKYLTTYQTRNRDDWIPLQGLKTWKQYAQDKDLPHPAAPLAGNIIDNTNNESLSDKISIFNGDITNLKIDAIVNAANSRLKRGGGVDGAIHKAAGKYLQDECDSLNGCETGHAKITGGYELPAKYVLQTVGPRGEQPEALKACYLNTLRLATENNIRSVAFPCISTGIYGYPNEAAAHVAVYNVRKFLERESDKIDRVIFCIFLEVDKNIYQQVLQTYFPVVKA